MSQPILVLDLDGTLVDTAADLVGTLNAILAQEGLDPVTFDEAVTMVGNGARAMLAKAFGDQADDARLDALMPRFIDHYSSHIAEASRPFPGVPQSLDRFSAAGWHLAVCTNKFEGLSRTLLGELGLADRFAAIAGQDTFGVRKPDPGHLTGTIALAGADPLRAVMVGDSEVDVKTAKAAGIPVVAVSFGYSPIPAGELGADAVIDHYDALYDVAVSLLEAPRSS